jgi:hypothetical protein
MIRMNTARPPILFVAIWGLFAAAMLFGQHEVMSHGTKLANVVDINDAEMPVQIASLD